MASLTRPKSFAIRKLRLTRSLPGLISSPQIPQLDVSWCILTGRNEGSIKAVTKRLPVNTWADHCDRRLKGQTPVHGIGNPKCFSSPHHVAILRVAMSSLFSPTTHVCPKPVALWPTLWVAVWAWSSLISLPSAVSTLLWDLLVPTPCPGRRVHLP